MVHFFKHTAFRVWASLALGVLASLALVPSLQAQVGLRWTLVPAGVLVLAAFFLVGWVFNRLGLVLADRAIREAAIWERAGEPDQAEKAYGRAVAVFDSFLVSPRARRRRSGRLTSRLARFYLARGERRQDTDVYINAHIRSNPGDAEAAEAWLRRVLGNGRPTPQDQDIIQRIGEFNAENPAILKLLARLYLAEERTDFAALETYRRLLGGDGATDPNLTRDLATLFMDKGRVDEWAMELYLAAAGRGGDETFLRGVAACAHWVEETPRNAHLHQAARELISDLSPRQLRGMRMGFIPPDAEAPAPERAGTLAALGAGGRLVGRIIRLAAGFGVSILGRASRRLAHGLQRLRRSPRFRPVLGWGMVILLGAGAVFFLINTAGHLLRSKTAETRTAVPVPIAVTDRFTIQVAAYLKQGHAEKFVDQLQAQGIDAYWTAATGKKKRWFQVRIHHFPDKAAARAFGESLKSRGLIDDFYVANYRRP
jgi:tetratricopeptide (TPR) repeat protein